MRHDDSSTSIKLEMVRPGEIFKLKKCPKTGGYAMGCYPTLRDGMFFPFLLLRTAAGTGYTDGGHGGFDGGAITWRAASAAHRTSLTFSINWAMV